MFLSFDPQVLIKNIINENDLNQKRFNKYLELCFKEAKPAVGQTAKEVVWSKNKSKLYRFIPTQKELHPVPILMTYALINKPYIMDLRPGNSLVEYLVNRGFDCYMIDWGTPGLEDKELKFDNYICDYMKPVFQKVLNHSGAKELTMLGYCMGGTLTAIFAAHYNYLPIKNLVFLAAPIDFGDAGHYSLWLKEKYFNVDKMVDVLGLIPPEMVDYGNKMLKPVSNFYNTYNKLWENLSNEKYVDDWRFLDYWVNDGVPFPGESFRQWIKEFYQNNLLVKKEFKIRNQIIDLNQIKCPVLNITAKKDHIVLPKQSEAIAQYISGSCEQFPVPAGHVSLVIGRQALNITWPKISQWLAS